MAKAIPEPTYRQENSAPDGRVIATQHGDVYLWHFEGMSSAYRVDAFNGEPTGARTNVGSKLPSRLLGSAYQIVPFYGRETERQQLGEWLANPAEPSLSVRLVHGRGGQGKSRLAAQFAREASAAGWAVVAASHHTHTTIAMRHGEVSATSPRGLLMLIDYADRWPVADLAQLITDHLSLARPLRLLALARSPSGWWPRIQSAVNDAGFFDVGMIDLPPLALDMRTRTAVFEQAAGAFAEELAVPGTERVLPPQGLDSDPEFSHVLTIHMAALVAVDRTRHRSVGPVAPGMLTGYLLGREKHAWAEARDAKGVSSLPFEIQRVVFDAVLARALSHQDAVDLLAATRVADSIQNLNQMLLDHALFYLPSEPGMLLEPLYPDKLAEDFLALCTTKTESIDFLDPWARDAITLMLAPNADGQSAPYTRNAMTMLIETARNWPTFAEQVLSPLLHKQPILAIRAGGAALSRLMPLLRLDKALAVVIHALLPDRPDVDLDAAAAELTDFVTESSLAPSASSIDKAKALNDRSIRYFNAGRWQDALDSSQKVLELYRQLADNDPGAFTADLAASLVNIGNRLDVMGRWEQGLAATEIAVNMYRSLSRLDPDVFDPSLAQALNNMSKRLANLGRWEDGLVIAREAVALWRKVDNRLDKGPSHGLAGSLNNLGTLLGRMRMGGEALAVAKETVAIYRELASEQPNAFNANFAKSLVTLGSVLGGLGSSEAGLLAIEEAVTICRELARQRPDSFNELLALSLNNLGNSLAHLKRPALALAATEEAVALYRVLFTQRRQTFIRDLALTLTNLADRQNDVGLLPESLAAIDEAVTLYRQVPRQFLDAVTDDLLNTLIRLAATLNRSGRHEEALAANQEAVSRARELAGQHPEHFKRALALSLIDLGVRLTRDGRLEAAYEADVEALDNFLDLYSQSPTTVQEELGIAMKYVACDLRDMGRPEIEIRAQIERLLSLRGVDLTEIRLLGFHNDARDDS